MKLTKLFFEAYRSLLNLELDINDNCIGFVGTNESGKSNILYAINKLDKNNKLSINDTPKMDKSLNPSIIFRFSPEGEQKQKIIDYSENWIKNNSYIDENIISSEFNINYTIQYNKDKNTEERFFTIENLFQDIKDYNILKFENRNDVFNIYISDNYIPIKNAILVKKQDLDSNQKILNSLNEIEKLNEKIESLEHKISIEKENEPEKIVTNQEQESETINENNKNDVTDSPSKEKKELSDLLEEKNRLIELAKNYGFDYQSYENIIKELEANNATLNTLNDSLEKINNEILQLENTENRTPEQQTQLDGSRNKKKKTETQVNQTKTKIQDNHLFIKNFKLPIEEKYTENKSELFKHINHDISNLIEDFLPKIVFWEYSDNFLLQSEIPFSDIIEKNNLSDISRPLVNVFRIGLGIKNIDDLKLKINEIQNDQNERSRIETNLKTKINEYIKSVWTDYNQEMKITLEKERIRFEIFDPKCDNASYYNMSERSQGCQTFISFLLTVGVEAKQGVINNTILLLDEPETHLHPSGVRFMLKELIKMSENNNQVFFATHSIFMIDRNNFDRHVILEKKNEKTFIKLAKKNRIGYFMQEEVLYSTLDIDLNRDFNSTNKFNFVFEGDADAIIFEFFYNTLTKKETPFPIESASFYQGGKCSDIIKYFKQKPIQLGTKWVFMLDRDDPANQLKGFINDKYKDYIDNDIFVFQYGKDSFNIVELEDIMPKDIIKNVIDETSKYFGKSITSSQIEKFESNEIIFSDFINSIVVEDIKPEEFKEKFKEIFNKNIASKFSSMKKNDFSDQFGEYKAWAKNCLDSVIEKTTNKLKKE